MKDMHMVLRSTWNMDIGCCIDIGRSRNLFSCISEIDKHYRTIWEPYKYQT